MHKYLLLLFILWFSFNALGQQYQSSKSEITFFSSAPIEDITASNQSAVSLFDIETGELAISIPINKFTFDKALMEEHFNEKYLESEKYPKATFAGKVNPLIRVGSNTSAIAVGKLTLHGVTKAVTISGKIEWSEDRVLLKSDFSIKLDDYKIKIPKLMWQNIAEEVNVHVELIFKPI